MRMDATGVPKTWTRATGTNYWPGYIAWYGLVQLGYYLRGYGSEYLAAFLRQVEWLEKHAIRRDDGAVVWVMNFDNPENGVLLRAPWVSAHAQGLVISALVRGLRVTKSSRLRELLQDSTRIFSLDAGQGGIRATSDDKLFYTEVPGGSVPGILDGFMTSLLGLYDLFIETEEPRTEELFRNGIKGLKGLLPYWDYQRKWSWYGLRENLCTPAYHCLNRLLLGVLGRLTADQEFTELAECWDPANFSQLERVTIYSKFLISKNGARLRHRTWSFKSLPDK
jgi:heparosan-N-sulfate-glucuronate 5-epimerase